VELTDVATRLFRRFGLVILLAIVLPILAVGAFVLRQPPAYTAHARIVAAGQTPRSQAEAASVVSQVQALATSRDVVASALVSAHVGRDPDKVIAAITVTGLGSSALADVGYTDRDPAIAQQVTGVVATAVAGQLDSVRVGGLPDVLKDVDNQLTDLATKRAPIAAEAQANPKDPVAQNRLAGIDRLISDLSGDRNRLSEEAAAAGHSSVVATPTRPAHPDSRGLAAKLAIAGILGLVIGLIIVGLNETLRPTVSGGSRVARLLDVPMLGTVGSDPVVLADIGRRIRLAARRVGVSTVVLARATRVALPPELVDRIEAATLRPAPVPGRVAIPIDIDDTQLLGLPSAGSGERLQLGGEKPGDGHDGVRGIGSVAVLTGTENSGRPGRLHRVCALEELDPNAESERIGLVVLAGGNTRLRAVDGVRDLMTAAGWPLLGVLSDGARHRGGR
jgi:capsular polysaccharide biosynthesis protein